MKKMIPALYLLAAANVFAHELHDFKHVKDRVLTGKKIHVVIDHAKCVATDKSADSGLVSVFTPGNVWIAKDHVAGSFRHFTLNNPKFLDRPVYEFVSYQITNEGSVNLVGQVLDAVNYAPLSPKTDIRCKIDSGAKIYT